MAEILDFGQRKLAFERNLVALACAVEATFDGIYDDIAFDLIELANEVRALPEPVLARIYELGSHMWSGHDSAVRAARRFLDDVQSGLCGRVSGRRA